MSNKYENLQVKVTKLGQTNDIVEGILAHLKIGNSLYLDISPSELFSTSTVIKIVEGKEYDLVYTEKDIYKIESISPSILWINSNK